MLPTPGLIDQVTDWFAEFCTVAARVSVWPWYTVTLCGDNETMIGGFKVQVALSDPLGVTTLVAITVTVCAAAIVAGAV